MNEDPQNPSFVEKRKWVLIGLGHWKLNSRASSCGLWNVKKWDSDLIEKEIKDGGRVGSCGYMSRIRPREERVRPKEERHWSTEWREESGKEWKSRLSWRASWELMLRFSM